MALADDPHWGPYLAARATYFTGCAARVAATAATMTPSTAPGWARSLLAPEQASHLMIRRAAGE
jgi:hypothetical protein